LYSIDYDALHRPLTHWLSINGASRQTIERFEYRDATNADGTENASLTEGPCRQSRRPRRAPLRSSGLVQTVREDFKGNVQEIRRTLASAYDAPVIDWQAGSSTARLEDETFVQVTEYDALRFECDERQ